MHVAYIYSRILWRDTRVVQVHEENQRNMRKYQEQLVQANGQLEEEQRAKDGARENMINMDRRAHSLSNALEEARTMLEQADRARRWGQF